MSQTLKRSSLKKGKVTNVGIDMLELKSALGPILAPITSSINTLNDTIASLVNNWNRDNTHEMEKRNFLSDLNSTSINAEMIAADTHRLSKNYMALNDQVNNYQQNFRLINEKLANIEKILSSMVKRQVKRRNLDSDVMDVLHHFEQYLNAMRKDDSANFSEETAPQLSEPITTLDTGPTQVLTLNNEDDFPNGSWLGDPCVPKSRVRCPLRPEDLVYINSKCNSAEKMALTLLDHLFSKDILAVSNLSGKSKLGKRKLDPLMVYGIKCHLMYIFSITEKQWYKIKQNIDSKCRSAAKKRRLTPEYCISVEAELYPEESQSKDSLPDYSNNLTTREELERPKTRVIRTLQGDIEVLAADHVLRFQDLHNIHVLDGDHILPIISSDGEEGENGIPSRSYSEPSHLAIVAEDTNTEQSQLAIVAEDAGLSTADTVSFVMEPMLEVLAESGSLISDPGGLPEER